LLEYFYTYGTADTLTADILTADTLTADTFNQEIFKEFWQLWPSIL